MTIGIIGGGQLGMMLAEAIKHKGHNAIALDPNPKCSCSAVCDVIVGEYDDITKLEELCNKCDVLTYEFENISSQALYLIEKSNKLKQGILPLEISQNRLKEKAFALKHGLKTVKYKPIYNKDELAVGLKEIGYPSIYKTSTLGYDGHGQYVIRSSKDINKVVLDKEGILESMLDFDYEASIILFNDGVNIRYLPISVNMAYKNILDLSIVQDNLPIKDKLIKYSVDFMKNSDLRGIITLEYFIKDNEIYFNEMAPRPHNSGHYSIEGCDYSQYEMLTKYLLGEELPTPKLLSSTVMKNILGYNYDNFNNMIIDNNTFKHDYHKTGIKEYRKMAHVTFTNTTLDDYNKKYKKFFKEI